MGKHFQTILVDISISYILNVTVISVIVTLLNIRVSLMPSNLNTFIVAASGVNPLPMHSTKDCRYLTAVQL